MSKAGYFPPALPANILLNKLYSMVSTAEIPEEVELKLPDYENGIYREHHVTTQVDMVKQLLQEYAKWWRLIMLYPRLRIVAPPPIYFVSYAHFSLGLETFFIDTYRYLGDVELSARKWGGPEDIQGVLHTTGAYRAVFGPLPPPWQDMTRISENIIGNNDVTPLR